MVELVYAEEYNRITDAYAREKQVQNWGRAKREALVDGKPELLSGLAKKRFYKNPPLASHIDHPRHQGDVQRLVDILELE